jgi:uncharacterized protein YhaN
MLELLLANQKRAEADWDELKAKMDSNQAKMEAIQEKAEARMAKFEDKMDYYKKRMVMLDVNHKSIMACVVTVRQIVQFVTVQFDSRSSSVRSSSQLVLDK